jgi:hypothetical protein
MAAFASAFDRFIPRAPDHDRRSSSSAGQPPWLFGYGQPAPIARVWEGSRLAAALTGEILWRADALVRGGGNLPPELRRELVRRWCDLLRDIFAPFQSVALAPIWLSANDGAVRKLAASIYDEGAFAQLPILADALEDAGCDNAEVLAHCRSQGPHVRGCWVVDLILGKG